MQINKVHIPSKYVKSVEDARTIAAAIAPHKARLLELRQLALAGTLSQADKEWMEELLVRAGEGVGDSCAWADCRECPRKDEEVIFFVHDACHAKEFYTRTSAILDRIEDTILVQYPRSFVIRIATVLCEGTTDHPCGKSQGLCKEWKDRPKSERVEATSRVMACLLASPPFDTSTMLVVGKKEGKMAAQLAGLQKSVMLMFGSLPTECIHRSVWKDKRWKHAALAVMPHPGSRQFASATGRQDVAGALSKVGIEVEPDQISQRGTKRRASSASSSMA